MFSIIQLWYCLFHKTLPRFSVFIYWISLRFYETDCVEGNHILLTNLTKIWPRSWYLVCCIQIRGLVFDLGKKLFYRNLISTKGRHTHKKSVFLVVGPLRFSPPYTNGLVVHATWTGFLLSGREGYPSLHP